MDFRAASKQKGIRMAMQVAALTLGAGAVAMAATATDAKADPAPAQAGVDGNSMDPAQTEPMRVTGWSCWGPISRGPLAPPEQPADFASLLAEVPL